jgi:4-amino-4-deoxy-L-arabinose transferase-like glycosyltransferase
LAWTLTGLTGHTPWRADESVQLALALDVLDGQRWLAPELGGAPWLDTPPLAVWASAAAIGAFSPWLPAHDAARLPGMLALLATFWALLRWSLPRLQRRDRWAAGLALFGAMALVIPAHGAAAELWTLAGFALLAAGLTRPDRRWPRTAVLIAAGIGIAALAGGAQLWLAAVMATAAVSLVAPRRSQHGAHIAGVVAGSLPMLLWASALAHQGLLAGWLRADPLLAVVTGHTGPGGGFFVEIRGLLWSWPLWPLALATLWHRRANLLTEPRLIGSLAILVCALLVWWITPGGRDTRALALLAPLALLAGPGLLRLERGQAQALHAFGIVLFLSLLSLLWLFWAGAHLGAPEPFASRVARLLRQYDGQWEAWPVALAAAASLAAVLLIAGLRRSPVRPLLAWCIGASITWLLVILLGRHWLESRFSYQPMVQSLAAHWPQGDCVAAAPGLRPAVAASVRVYAGHGVLRGPEATRCGWALATLPRAVADLPPNTEVVWRGRRGGDRHESHVLYRRP